MDWERQRSAICRGRSYPSGGVCSITGEILRQEIFSDLSNYGRGEVAEALVEWIISKNLKPKDNLADRFIDEVQKISKKTGQINQAVKKYNQCLIYCEQQGEDLAIIQLKKVIAAHPTFLKAYQLLALLYLHTAQYTKARQILKRQENWIRRMTLRCAICMNCR